MCHQEMPSQVFRCICIWPSWWVLTLFSFMWCKITWAESLHYSVECMRSTQNWMAISGGSRLTKACWQCARLTPQRLNCPSECISKVLWYNSEAKSSEFSISGITRTWKSTGIQQWLRERSPPQLCFQAGRLSSKLMWRRLSWPQWGPMVAGRAKSGQQICEGLIMRDSETP